MAQTFSDLIAHNPKIGQFYTQEEWDWTHKCNEATGSELMDMWMGNLRLNTKEILPHCATIREICEGYGVNKAAILIGAGPSLNKNLDLLRDLCVYNASFPFEVQPFLFFCCNHEFKRMAKLGIIPHFVVLLDGSDNIYEQLCVDIPRQGRGSVLLAPPRASNKLLTEWKRQGREVLFFLGDNPELVKEFERLTGRKVNGTKEVMVFGGNVLNQMYAVASGYMGCSVFMAVGNDLCYEYDPDLDKRRSTYYADGNYTTNLASGRDEAKKNVPWMGFTVEESLILPGSFNVKWVPKATTGQLLLYKKWIEVRVAIEEGHNKKFHYYNCSEGILGSMCRDKSKEGFFDLKNWFLLDELIPRRWHTRTLRQAATEFLEARKMLCQRIAGETLIGAGLAAN